MKNRILIFILALCLFATGCSLADPAAAMPEATLGDRLIGCYVTEGYIDVEYSLTEAEIMAVLNGGTIDEAAVQDRRRIYAEYIPDEDPDRPGEFIFPGVEGLAMFAPTIGTGNDSYVSTQTQLQDIKAHYYSTDAGDWSELSGTVYIQEGEFLHYNWHANPVYQTPEGDVYLTPGQGMSGNSIGSASLVLSEETETKENGLTVGSGGGKFSVTFECVPLPERIRVIEMSAEGKALAVTEYIPMALPESYKTRPDTEYIITEVISADSVSREIVSPEDTATYISVLVPAEGKYLEPRLSEVVWAE